MRHAQIRPSDGILSPARGVTKPGAGCLFEVEEGARPNVNDAAEVWADYLVCLISRRFLGVLCADRRFPSEYIDGRVNHISSDKRGSAMKGSLWLSCMVVVVVLSAGMNRERAWADPPKTMGSIEQIDAEFGKLVPADATIEVLAEGFDWSEGPVWVDDGGYLLFSDIPRNQIVKWREGEGTSIFMQRAGYTGEPRFSGGEPGTNGLILDAQGRLVMCCHGDRLIRRIEKDGTATTLAAAYDGKRLNSPNDLVYHSHGDLYFTDPPYGLPEGFDDPARVGLLRRVSRVPQRPSNTADQRDDSPQRHRFVTG